ncbi:MAG: M20/M25/M40 family metallo-hydrolase [Candidatus Nanohaloarchaea archaeon]|nr:M20/M25/M40 family metallo-hydrolase [Candidatus Nanohaloarchaea archaeon]
MDEVELAQELMKFDTTSPVTDPDIMEFLERFLQVEGIDTEIRDIDGVKNLVATTGSGDTSICFNGHLDVVPPESGWEVTEPFEPVVKDGRLYGRGAADMKAAAAAQVMAFTDLHDNPSFEGELTLMLAGDEEQGGFKGTKPMVEDMPSFDYAVVGEPTDLNIQVGTRGVFWLTVFLEGEPAHAARPEAGTNVLERVPEIIKKLQKLEMEYEPDAKLPDPSFTVTGVETDMTQNSIPGEALIQVDARYLPSQNPASIVKRVRDLLTDNGVDARVEVIDHGGAFKLDDDRFQRIATEVLTEVRGEEPRHITEGGASDGRFFAARGTPFIELGVNQEPGHTTDEYCSVESVSQLREAYRGIAKRLTG